MKITKCVKDILPMESVDVIGYIVNSGDWRALTVKYLGDMDDEEFNLSNNELSNPLGVFIGSNTPLYDQIIKMISEYDNNP